MYLLLSTFYIREGIMKNTRKFIYFFAVIAAIGFAILSLTGCPTPDDGGTETGKETVATPKANPPAGAVASGANLTLTSLTNGAEIWYTTNGNAPAKNGVGSTKYTSPFTITPPVTVKAIAVKNGMNDSGIMTASYTLQTGGSLPENATELIEGKWSDGNLTSIIGGQWFKFTATAGTQYIHAGFGTMSTTFGMYVQVYDSSGAKVGTETNLDGSTKYVSKSVTSGQEYYIKVRRYSSTTNGNGTYQIAFNKSSTAPSATVTLPSDATLLTEGIWSDGNLTSSIGEQWFKFTASADPQYIHAGFGTLDTLMGMYVQVYDSSGAKVGDETNLKSNTKYISRAVTPEEEYYIKVRLYLSSYTGTYQIAFNKSSTAPIVTVTLPSSATPLTENIWADGNLTSTIGEQWFKFTASADTQYIHAAPGTMNFTSGGVYVQVYDSSGTAVGTESKLFGNYNRNTSQSLSVGQEYYIKVRLYSSSYTGTYQIVFTKSSTTPEPLPSNATQLTESIWANGNLTSSIGEQWFKFTASADTQYIHAGFGSMSTTFGYYVQVYDLSGIKVGTETNLYGNVKYVSISLTPGQEYYIKVRRYSSTTSGNGTYQIAFNKSSTAPSLFSTAITLTENIWTGGNLTSSIGEQWFKFNASESPQYIHVSFGTLSPTIGLKVQVYDSSITTVEAETVLDYDTKYISISVTPEQEYYIIVQSNRYSYTGTYNIAFNKSSTAPSTTVTLPSSVDTLTENIWATNGNLTSSSSVQWFKFTATANTQYIHAVFGTIPTTGMNVQVYNSSGTSVVTDSLLYGTGSDSFISLSVTQGQTYYIRVWPNVYKGTYQIAFNQSPTAPAITLPTSNVTPLTANIWADGNFDAIDGKQWFSFTATANPQYILFKAGTINSLFGVYTQVYDSNGVKVGDMANLSNTRYISRSVTSGQVYYIQIRPAYDAGTYQIGFNASPTRPTL